MKVEHWQPQKDGVLSEAAMRRRLEQLGYRVTRYVALRLAFTRAVQC
jgi:hypothetical protein